MKPELEKFREVSKQTYGSVSAIAKRFSVSRKTVYQWIEENEEFKHEVVDSRGELLDKCISTSRVVALGIPELDESGRIIGWKERPNGRMLRYFMSTLGRNDPLWNMSGTGENNSQIIIEYARVLTKPEYKELLELTDKIQNDGENE